MQLAAVLRSIYTTYQQPMLDYRVFTVIEFTVDGQSHIVSVEQLWFYTIRSFKVSHNEIVLYVWLRVTHDD